MVGAQLEILNHYKHLISLNTLDFLIFLSHKISSFCDLSWSECSVCPLCSVSSALFQFCQPKQMLASIASDFVSIKLQRSVKADEILTSVRCKGEVEMLISASLSYRIFDLLSWAFGLHLLSFAETRSKKNSDIKTGDSKSLVSLSTFCCLTRPWLN